MRVLQSTVGQENHKGERIGKGDASLFGLLFPSFTHTFLSGYCSDFTPRFPRHTAVLVIHLFSLPCVHQPAHPRRTVCGQVRLRASGLPSVYIPNTAMEMVHVRILPHHPSPYTKLGAYRRRRISKSLSVQKGRHVIRVSHLRS